MSLRYKLTFIDVVEDRQPLPRRSKSLPCKSRERSTPSLEDQYIIETAQRLLQALPPLPPVPARPVVPPQQHTVQELDTIEADACSEDTGPLLTLQNFFQQFLWVAFVVRRALAGFSRV